MPEAKEVFVSLKDNLKSRTMSSARSRGSTTRKSRGSTPAFREPRTKSKLVFRDSQKTIQRADVKVFLYLDIMSLEKMPEKALDCKVELTHTTHKITKLQDQYTTRTDFQLSEVKDGKYPIFTVSLTQDNIEDITDVSDFPLLITVYESRIYESEDEEEEEEINKPDPSKKAVKMVDDKKVRPSTSEVPSAEEEGLNEEELEEEIPEPRTYWHPLLQGKLDLLPFFAIERTDTEISCLLYPLESTGEVITATVHYKIYTVQPLLKLAEYTNVAFITLESIYNAPEAVMEDPMSLVVMLSYQSKLTEYDSDIEVVKNEICSFKYLERNVIGKQTMYFNWETIKDPSFNNFQKLGTRGYGELNLYSIFKKLLGTDGVNFNYDQISALSDVALVSNSMHRYALNHDMVTLLQQVIANDEQNLLIEVYRESNPDEILLQGTVEVQIFLYPLINAMRFAVVLKPPNLFSPIPVPSSKPTLAALQKGKPQSKKKSSALTTQAALPIDMPTFCILNICFAYPITENFNETSIFKITKIPCNVLKGCQMHKKPIEEQGKDTVMCHLCEHFFSKFDSWVFEISRYVDQNDIKDYHCDIKLRHCEKANLSTILFKLISCDFNPRLKTKTNRDFQDLIARTFNDLSERLYRLLSELYSDMQAPGGIVTNDFSEPIVNFNFNMVKYLTEAGCHDLAEYITIKLQEQFPKSIQLKFVKFLYQLERQKFDEASEYFEGEMDESRVELIEISSYYIEFMAIWADELADENAEIEYITNTFRNYLEKHYFYVDGWILLHCIYKRFNYMPGIEFTRWKYENMSNLVINDPNQNMLPKTRWDIYCGYKLTLTDTKSKLFYEVFQNFTDMGWYKFAEFVWEEIAPQVPPDERLIFSNLLSVLLEEPKPMSKSKNVPPKASGGNVSLLAAHVAQSNGQMEFAKENMGGAMGNYARILQSQSIDDFTDFELSILRYALYALQMEEWEHAIMALSKIPAWSGNQLPVKFYLGKSYYKAGDLATAKEKFIECTFQPMHMPDVWAYLALINLKMDINYEALECWRYANIQSNTVICEDVINELKQINPEHIFLYVDMPRQHGCDH